MRRWTLAAIGLFFVVSAGAQTRTFLRTGEILRSGEYLVSVNRQFFAVMQVDGNFCTHPRIDPIRGPGPSLWCSNVTGTGGSFIAAMQKDGNFCVYPSHGDVQSGPAIWCSNAVAPGEVFYAIQNGDGNFIVHAGTDPQNSRGVLFQSGVVMSQVALTMPKAGTGAIGWPDGQMCPPLCARNLKVGSSVSLTALAQPGYTLTGWTGSCSNPSNPCVLIVAAGGLQNVGITLPPDVTITATPPAGGTIQWPDGTTCGTVCSKTVPLGSRVTVIASPASPQVFVSWTGPCAGQPATCALTATANMTPVAVAFKTPDVVVTAVAPAGGKITWPDGSTCGTTCSKSVPAGTRVVVTAHPDNVHQFVSWQGACLNQPARCEFTAAANQTFSAVLRHELSGPIGTTGDIVGGTFTPTPGSGTVSADPSPAVTAAITVASTAVTTALQTGTLTATTPTGATVTIPREVQALVLAVVTGDRNAATPLKTAFAASGSQAVGPLVDSLIGLISSPATGQLADAVGHFNTVVNESDPAFLQNPPAALLAVQTVLAQLVAAAQAAG